MKKLTFVDIINSKNPILKMILEEVEKLNPANDKPLTKILKKLHVNNLEVIYGNKTYTLSDIKITTEIIIKRPRRIQTRTKGKRRMNKLIKDSIKIMEEKILTNALKILYKSV